MILCAKFREHHIVSIAHRIPLGQHLFDCYQLCPAGSNRCSDRAADPQQSGVASGILNNRWTQRTSPDTEEIIAEE
jgi:hypothetical protein